MFVKLPHVVWSEYHVLSGFDMAYTKRPYKRRRVTKRRYGAKRTKRRYARRGKTIRGKCITGCGDYYVGESSRKKSHPFHSSGYGKLSVPKESWWDWLCDGLWRSAAILGPTVIAIAAAQYAPAILTYLASKNIGFEKVGAWVKGLKPGVIRALPSGVQASLGVLQEELLAIENKDIDYQAPEYDMGWNHDMSNPFITSNPKPVKEMQLIDIGPYIDTTSSISTGQMYGSLSDANAAKLVRLAKVAKLKAARQKAAEIEMDDTTRRGRKRKDGEDGLNWPMGYKQTGRSFSDTQPSLQSLKHPRRFKYQYGNDEGTLDIGGDRYNDQLPFLPPYGYDYVFGNEGGFSPNLSLGEIRNGLANLKPESDRKKNKRKLDMIRRHANL